MGLVSSIGLFAGATITPFIAIVDRAIVENISGRCN